MSNLMKKQENTNLSFWGREVEDDAVCAFFFQNLNRDFNTYINCAYLCHTRAFGSVG
jgi:hypothetical protein